MTYEELEHEIMRMSASATHAGRVRFASETIGLLRSSAAEAIQTELSDSERFLLAEILDRAKARTFDGLRTKLKQLTDSLSSDECRAIEFHPDVTELLCALESLIEYSVTLDPNFIGKIAINMVNSIDHAIGGDSQTYYQNKFGGVASESQALEHAFFRLPTSAWRIYYRLAFRSRHSETIEESYGDRSH